MEKSEKNIEGKFLKIVCPKCSKARTVFGKSSTVVKCDNCGYLLLKTGGGKSKIRAKINEVL